METVWQYEYQVERDRWTMQIVAFASANDARAHAQNNLVPGIRFRLVQITYHGPETV